jgi:hypothetical protein
LNYSAIVNLVKSMIYLFAIIGSTVGSYVPAIFGASLLSPISLIGGLVGGIAGIWLALRMDF